MGFNVGADFQIDFNRPADHSFDHERQEICTARAIRICYRLDITIVLLSFDMSTRAYVISGRYANKKNARLNNLA